MTADTVPPRNLWLAAYEKVSDATSRVVVAIEVVARSAAKAAEEAYLARLATKRIEERIDDLGTAAEEIRNEQLAQTRTFSDYFAKLSPSAAEVQERQRMAANVEYLVRTMKGFNERLTAVEKHRAQLHAVQGNGTENGNGDAE